MFNELNGEKGSAIERSLPFLKSESYDRELSMPLQEGGENFPGNVFWLRLCAGDRIVEGKMFQPKENGNRSILIFEPGMPGDSNLWMESKHVPKLLEKGFSVFCIRHGGTQVNNESAPTYVNCPERVAAGQERELDFIGCQDPTTITEIDREPEIAMRALAGSFDSIYLVGHSNGGSSELYSLTNLPEEITDKVRSVVSLAGFIGSYDQETDQFDREGRFDSAGTNGYYEYCNKFLNMGDLAENVEEKKKVFERIYSHKLPEHIQLSLITSDKDEYIPLSSAKDYQEYAGRGIRIIDKTEDTPDYHDLKNLQPETLLRVLSIYHPKSKHSVTFGNESGGAFSER